MKRRAYIATFLLLVLVVVSVLAFILSAFTQDSFPGALIRSRFEPHRIGAIAAGVMVVVLGAVIFAGPRAAHGARTTQRMGKGLFGLLILGAYAFFSCFMFVNAIERLLVRTTAHDSRFYLTSAWPLHTRGCNRVAWYEQKVDETIDTCPTFPLFNNDAGRDGRRASVVHVLGGAYGVRVLSVHALDSSFGRQDLSAMVVGGPAGPPPGK